MAAEKDRNFETDVRAARDAGLEDIDSAAVAEDRIQARAYERYQLRGGGDGRVLEDRFEAERDLRTGEAR